MLSIKDLKKANEKRLKRLNTPYQSKNKVKVLVFDKDLPHDDRLINPIIADVHEQEHKGVHALGGCSVIKTINPNAEIHAVDRADYMDVINYAIENNIRVINASFSGFKTSNSEIALKKYAEWGGIFVAAAGNNGRDTISYPSSSPYTISVSATNSKDNNSALVDITTDSYWQVKRYQREETISFSGTSCASPAGAGVASHYISENPSGNLYSFKRWLLINSIQDLDLLPENIKGDKLEAGERFFIFPDNPIDPLSPVRISLKKGDKTMLFNGLPKDLRVAPFFKQYSKEFNALCTELRPIFEAAGFQVEWNEDTETATLSR